MRVLIVSDVHSNIEAFQSVVHDASNRGGFDKIWSLGDLVGYGPDPLACLDLLVEHPHIAIAGNHDLGAVGEITLDDFNQHAADANRWTASILTEKWVNFIKSQQQKIEIDEFTLVHGSPRNPIWEYVTTEEIAAANFTYFDTYWCLLGHSHIAFICRPEGNSARFSEFPIDSPVLLTDEAVIINPGSVGQPRDGDPRASYAVYDSDGPYITHYRVEYDIETVQRKMRETSLPEILIDRLPLGR